MSELDTKINAYYQSFRDAFRKENFPELFVQIEKHNSNSAAQTHRMGSFAILYTPVRYRPDIMIIANNPSWFDKYDFDTAEAIVEELMDGPPKVVSYVDHNHVFAHRLQDAFRRLDRIDLLQNCVGMNRLWLQTGPENASWNKACRTRSAQLGVSLIEYCEQKSIEIIKLIRPRVALLVGSKAQKLMPEQLMGDIDVKHVAYPLGGGITELGSQLKEIIQNLDEVRRGHGKDAVGALLKVKIPKGTKAQKLLLPGLVFNKNSGWVVSLMHKDSRASFGPFPREQQARLWIEKSVDVHANGNEYDRQIYALYSPSLDNDRPQNLEEIRSQDTSWVVMVADRLCVGPFRQRKDARQWSREKQGAGFLEKNEVNIMSVSRHR